MGIDMSRERPRVQRGHRKGKIRGRIKPNEHILFGLGKKRKNECSHLMGA